MEKLKKYNQILLAFLGTVVLFWGLLQRLGKTDDFIAKYGLDRDKNGQFDHEIEPFVFYRLNLQEGKLVDIIPDTLIEQLQRRLDGREN